MKRNSSSLKAFPLILLFTIIQAAACKNKINSSSIEGIQVSSASIRDKEVGCGMPLMAMNKDASVTEVNSLMKYFSTTNLGNSRKSLGALNVNENALVAKLENIRIPIVTRTKKEAFLDMVQHGDINSARRAVKMGYVDANFKITTPPVEDALFGASDCVFFSVGNPKGDPRYGSVALVLNNESDEANSAWGTYSSGWKFLNNENYDPEYLNKKLLADPNLSLPIEILNSYSKQIYYYKDWKYYFADTIINNLRNKPSGANTLDTLIAAPDFDSFWSIISSDKLAYLEGKIASKVLLKSISTILVSEADYEEIKNNPAVAVFKDKIQVE